MSTAVWITPALAAAAAVAVHMSVFFTIGLVTRDNSYVDVGWGLGFVVVAVVSLFAGRALEPRNLIVLALVVAWGLRLAIHIGTRKAGQGEDFRYREMRERWEPNVARNAFLRIYVLQGIIMLIVASPVIFINAFPRAGLTGLDVAGIVVAAFGIAYETAADAQLRRFKRRKARGETPKRVLSDGLWRFSRHPNYFGEILVWWGVFLLTLYRIEGLITAVGPALITVFLFRVSGAPLLEKRHEDDPEYRSYRARTNLIIPGRPRQQ